MKNKKTSNPFLTSIKLADGSTTPVELIRETLINFAWGFTGNSIVVFMSRSIDMAVFVNFILYYLTLSYIVNRTRYETKLGKFVILPGAAAMGAFSGYKFAQYISAFV
jgi:hypothetical protein